jgi:hypothetical protein
MMNYFVAFFIIRVTLNTAFAQIIPVGSFQSNAD